MLLPDVSVLIYAHRSDSITTHAKYAEWLTSLRPDRSRLRSLF